MPATGHASATVSVRASGYWLPNLRTVESTLVSASGWSRGPAARQAEDSSVFAWPVVRDAAENTAADLGVPIGDITGDAYVLPLEGQWSYLAGRGCALCSAELARDPDAAGQLLRDIFRSGLAGRPKLIP